jgi:hypothetical protein
MPTIGDTPCYPGVGEQGLRGRLLDSACEHCGHLVVLHSLVRPCAGCEAIHEARRERSPW